MTSAVGQLPGEATAPVAASNTTVGRLAAGMLVRGAGCAPSHYTFAFTPFLKTTYQHGLSSDRPICRAYSSASYCPLGSRCPDRHLSAAAAAAAPPPPVADKKDSNKYGHGHGYGHGGREGFSSLVCKHWLRGLCKKGDGCEFLHEYNLRKMPECNFFVRNGYCSNGDECLYLHIDPRSKLPPCPDYDNRGFCALGPTCPKKHVRRKAICPYYLAGFCPDGRTCQEGAHPKWSPVAIVPPQVAAAAEAALLREATGTTTEDGLPISPIIGDHQQPTHYDMDGQQRPVGERGGEDTYTRSGEFHGGFKDRGRGGRWRGRGSGRGARGRGRGDF
ncbi:RNA-binding component of cleavage and polyadenylation factor [Sporothrix epigloea]|uniref:mRNA 3'-end-processing protein n=1 Tax=Sporothrix epigloea TaxID=1892477 RepID=A0ABP0DLP7_9PEZI